MSDPGPDPRRSTGRLQIARALWYTSPGAVEIRTEHLRPPRRGEALVRTHYTAISRGTERLVFSGAIPEGEWSRMRAPLQSGEFPFPVKYGYSAAGIVESGPFDLAGRPVFCLHPHQDRFVAGVEWLTPIPPHIPLKRATLAANMETALNALWDSGAGPGDRIAVVGGGIIGLLTAHLAARLPGASVTVVDIDPARRLIAEKLGAGFSQPGSAPADADIVFHATPRSSGLELALSLAGFEGTIVEMSWYGTERVEIGLGGPFHSNRLRLISSQVGHVSASRRPRWTHRRRLETAIGLLDRPELDVLVENEIAFSEAQDKLPVIFAPENSGTGPSSGLPPVLRYD